MSVSADYLVYVVDQLVPFARVRSRRMFGGVGLYADDQFFALIADDVLYFKVDDSNRPDYAARGCQRFRPFEDEPIYSMNYYAVPPEVIEDSEELKLWARKSCAVAMTKATAKRTGPPRKAAKKKPAAKRTKR